MTVGDATPGAQRVDRWLWCARIFKTRTLAAKFVSDGNLRITRSGATTRAEKPSYVIRAGDTLIFTLHDRLRVIEILDCAVRRGPAREAQTLYEDRSPPPPNMEPAPMPFAREKGAGRPTKKDRRALQAIRTS